MAPHNPSAIDSQITKSVISSAPSSSDYRSCDSEPPVRFMCSFGGRILPRRHNANQLCYVGGNTHILAVERYSTFQSLLAELSDLCGNTEITVKYHLPNEDLDALISVTKDKDVENMIVEYDRFIWGRPEGSGQLLRLFLFPRSSSPAVSQTNEAVPPPVRVMCSFGGQILPRRHNANQLCYVGGNTHILTVERYSTFPSLLAELSDLCGNTEIAVKYHLPNEDLDALISVTKDKDVENMIVEYDRFICGRPEGSGQLLRLFLFPRSSSPAVSQTNEAVPPPVRVMCSFGGQILPRRHNANQLCYVGGNTHILTVERYSTFPSLLAELSDLCGNTEITIKYHLPNEDLDALISVTKDKDVENMIVEYDRFIWGRPEGSGQLLRLFLFPRSSSPAVSQTNEAVPPSVMQRDYLKLEALQEDTLGSTSIPLQSRRAIGTVPQSVRYEILDPSDVSPQQEFKLNDAESSIVEPMLKENTFILPSAAENLETLWTWLNEKDVYTVQILGDLGSGKSWLASHIIDRARASSLFDNIIWADGNERFGSRVVSSSYHRDRTSIRKVPERESYLAVLENFKYFHFKDIGILPPEVENYSLKLVFAGFWTTKFHRSMDNLSMDKILELKTLSQFEARLLFQNSCGFQLDHPDICEAVEVLLQKCNGIPSMIVVLAALVRRNLEEPSSTPIAILQKAYDLLIERSVSMGEVAYEMLPNKRVRDCFLYCFTINNGVSSTMNIITSWTVEGYLDGFNSGEEAYEKGREILMELIDCSLLISHDAEHVSFPFEMVRFTAGQIVSRYLKRVSPIYLKMHMAAPLLLLNNKLEITYSEGKKAATVEDSSLEVLLVYGNEARAPHEIPDVFFEKMESLRILSLFHVGIKSLPPSLSTLEYVHVLLLRDCRSLEDVNQIRALRLSYLNLSGCISLTEVPDDFFQNMTFLDYLDLSNTQLKQLPSSFYNLFYLEILIFKGCSHLETFYSLPQHSDLFKGSGSEIKTNPRRLKLEMLDLSGTKIADLQFLSECAHLTELRLRDCRKIEALPSLRSRVQIVDLSGSISFKEFQGKTLSDDVLYLDLSGTQIKELPMISVESELIQLLLKGCPHLEELPRLELQKLQVLNLSGSIHFKKFNNASLPLLKTLDLSETQVTQLPNLSEFSHLRHLVFRNCSRLETLPQLKELLKLEVLDLSGASAFKQFHDNYLGAMGKLQELNLSGTQVVEIPSLDLCHNLVKLIFRDCSKLETLPQLRALSRLNVLDLSGAVSFAGFQDQSFDDKYHLHVLDVSETQVVELPLLSGCSNLRQLLLRDCSKLKQLPPVDKLTRLEVLNLSGTKNLDLSIFSGCRELRQLSLRGCSNLEALSFDSMHTLEKVDLSETSIQMLPSCFSEFRNLNQLLLKGCSNLKMLPRLESFEKLKVLDISRNKVKEISRSVSEWTNSRFLLTLSKNYIWEFDHGKYSQRFHFILCSLKDWGKEKDMYLKMQEVVFGDMYYQTNHIRQLTEEPDKFFKICGFQTYPSGAEEVLIHAEVLYLKNNDFITGLSDLGTQHVQVMKECWIESCQNMESCFYGEEEDENDALAESLENLWVSKLFELKCLFRDVVNSKSFACLKNLYIECCPSLITVFSAHLELKQLETLEIKFCDKLENVSGDMVRTEQTFPRLKKLSLWKLPKLRSICRGALPSLEYLAVKRCPSLEKLPFSLNSTSRTLKIKGEKQWWDNLKCEDDTIKIHIDFTKLLEFL